MRANRLQGIPWHAEQFHLAKDNVRRYKGRCRYYSDDDGQCSCRCGKCNGSAHYMEDDAMSEE